VGKDDGTGRFPYSKLLADFCRLNADYAPARIRFYFKNPWDLVNNTGWYNHSTIPQGINMMLTNNEPDALNIYFVSNPAGNCGYNLPYGGVALNHSCAAETDHTWAHEVGHALSLPHPFIGWEGKTYNYQNTTPDKVTYDYTYFHDTLDTQAPAPLDTAFVEYLNGSNCALASDLFCDTKPDYLSYRWNCDAQSQSTTKEKDPAGADFYSDGSLYMSYASDACMNRFTDEQIAAMRAFVPAERPTWLSPGPPQPDITGVSVAISPAGNQITPDNGVTLTWKSVPHATHYLVIGSILSAFQVENFALLTTDTTAQTGTLYANKKYYWRVKPFNEWYTCAPYSAAATFITAPATAVATPDESGFRCYPSLLSPGQPIQLELPASWDQQDLHCAIFDMNGRQVWASGRLSGQTSIQLDLPSFQWPAGLYCCILQTPAGAKIQRISIF
jgi:hypothetical protein